LLAIVVSALQAIFDVIKNISGIEVVSLVSRDLARIRKIASRYGIEHLSPLFGVK